MESQYANLVGEIHSDMIVGSLTKIATLTGTIQPKVALSATIVAPSVVEFPSYKGAYTIYPEVTKQNFETRDKRMIDDLCVEAIPYHEFGNEYGDTVVIGGRINGI